MKHKRIFISADIEGVTGVVSREQLGPRGFEYQLARKWMTAEVSAACEGALAAGATEIVVADSHGNAQNILVDELPPSVQLIRNWPRPLSMMEGIQSGGFDAIFFVGYHCGNMDPRGTLSHTLRGDVILDVRFNGTSASETLISASVGGHFGVPVALVSGDDAYCDHARELLGTQITAVETKKSLTYSSSLASSPAQSVKKIREGARHSLEDVARLKPYRTAGPIDVEVDFLNRLNAETLCYIPYFERRGANTVAWRAQDAPDAAKGLSFISHHATSIFPMVPGFS